ncbi:MAG: hypothetical protein LUE29_05080 [Lachnospiraceae bacterium]|nr:hypothetical protein [Lachnospiraceae bacterium]
MSFYVLLFFTVLFWILYDWNIRGLAAAYGYGVTPYLLPLFYAGGTYLLYGLLLIVLVTSGAPFLDRGSLFTLQRTGRLPWCIGQMLYIFLANLLFQGIMILVQILTLIPHITPSTKWGSVLYTVANMPELLSGYSGFGAYNQTVILGMTAPEALAKEVILCTLLGSVIGAAVFLVNGLLRRGIGAIIAAAGALLTGYTTDVGVSLGWSLDEKLPFNWVNLTYYVNGKLNFGTNVAWLCGMFLFLAVAACVCVKKGWIRTTS